MTALGSSVDHFLDLAYSGNRRAAVRLVIDQMDSGVSAAGVIGNLLGPAQREVGERWHRAEWSTADEHLVTGVSQAALEALSSLAPATNPDIATLVVACAEGDWHSLPAQMFAENLRARGHDVVFLGPSTPAEDVASFLAARGPDVLAISCNLALSYIGTARLVDAAHRQRIPVLVGGRALTRQRGATLGADAWAADAEDASSILSGWHQDPPMVSTDPVPLDRAALVIEANASQMADRAFAVLEQQLPAMGGYDDRQRLRTREDLTYIVRYVAASLLVDDMEVFTTFLDWLRDLLAARGVPDAALQAGLRSLAPILDKADRRTAVLVTT